MKISWKARIMSAVLTCAMLLTSPVGAVKAAAEDTGKYISEVFIAYGKTEDEAKQWLTSHGWEPVEGDFNAGKSSNPVAAVMGVKRTSDPNDAVTDMAVMNMGTKENMGYSFDDYQKLLTKKKADIDEFVDCFMPVIQEYRENYNGKGSAAGKARAQLAHEMLNKLYDGEIDGKYAVHDTGMPLGDLFLNTTRREYGEAKYDKLSKNEQVKYGDLQQIILESSGPAILAVEQSLALATDSGEDSWLERLADMSYLSMKNLAELYADGNASLGDSAAKSLLMSKYGDAAKNLASDYETIQQELNWLALYCDEHDLWQHDGESVEMLSARKNAWFDALKAMDEAKYLDEYEKFTEDSLLYMQLASVAYEGDWGESLLDFFRPEDGKNYGEDSANFLPFAAALSEGQRAGVQFLTLQSLLSIGVNDEGGIKEAASLIGTVLNEKEQLSVYSGINRAIFRYGVALTSKAMMDKSRALSPYEQFWDMWGMSDIIAYSAFAVGTVTLVTGVVLSKLSATAVRIEMLPPIEYDEIIIGNAFGPSTGGIKQPTTYIDAGTRYNRTMLGAGRWMIGIGAAIMLASAAMKGYQLWTYFNRTFIPIPSYIVDEADIVTYETDKNGNEVKNINFDQFLYYEVVKCNRQDIGINSKAQDGVAQYAEWGCGDAADLNCDVGKQWLALYTVKSRAKGNPILADSLKLQTGSDSIPAGCTAPLHFFTYTYAADLGDEAYAFNNDMNGVYFFWDTDTNAFKTASTFTGGQLALAGIGGLAAGILGTTFVMMATKKRKDIPTTPIAA